MNSYSIMCEMIDEGRTLNRVRFETSYAWGPEAMEPLRRYMLNTCTLYTDENAAVYRVVELQNETRLEFLEGQPSMDINFGSEAPIHSVDFFFDLNKKNYLRSYPIRRANIRFKFLEDKMFSMEDGVHVIRSMIVPDSKLVIGRRDNKVGHVAFTGTEPGYTVSDTRVALEFNYGVVGYFEDKLISNYIYLPI